MAELKR